MRKNWALFGIGAALALGFAGYGVAAPVNVSPSACYYCCEDTNDCGNQGWWCEHNGVDCQDTVCHYGGGHDFCYENIEQ
jgi:hypothetical protein